MFTFDPSHPNTIAGQKEPFITIIAGFIMKDGQPMMAFGNMGGSTQPLGHVQHIVNMIDLGYNVQATSDAARWDHSQSATSDTLSLDVYLYDEIGPTLASWGHKFSSSTYKGSRGLGGRPRDPVERDYSLPQPVTQRSGAVMALRTRNPSTGSTARGRTHSERTELRSGGDQ